MDEEKVLTEQEDESTDNTIEKTEKVMRIAGKVVLGTLAAVLCAEAMSFRKKR